MSNVPPRRVKKVFKYYLASILAAIAGLGLAMTYLYTSNQKPPVVEPVRPPVKKPYSSNIAASGVVEAFNNDFGVAPILAGKVTKVWVSEGQTVEKGAPLYQLDTQQAEADVRILSANLAVQQAHLNMLKAAPRLEDLNPLKAAVAQADAQYKSLTTQLKRMEGIEDPRAITEDELVRKWFEVEAARSRREEAEAELKRAEAGTWTPEIRKATAEYNVIKAQLDQAKLVLDLSIIHAPRAGQVLKVNTHPGEYLAPGGSTAPILLGDVSKLQIRVDVDEVNASKIRPNMAASAYVKGNSSLKIPLQYVRIEPMMVPRKNLTGQNLERVDERVLQIIYTFDRPSFPVYPGEQLNVFIENPPGSTS